MTRYNIYSSLEESNTLVIVYLTKYANPESLSINLESGKGKVYEVPRGTPASSIPGIKKVTLEELIALKALLVNGTIRLLDTIGVIEAIDQMLSQED